VDSTQTDQTSRNRWRRRPVVSAVVRWTALLGPAIAALGFSVLLSRLWTKPDGAALSLAWWILISALTLCLLAVLERLAHRLLPLAALLNLSLLFPDRAPARYKVARTTWKPRDLERRLAATGAGSSGGDDTLRAHTVLELVAALSVHDRPTRGHSERVRIFADLIASELVLPESDQDRLRWASLLHDVGKLRVAPSLLNKPGPPSAAEWAKLHQHPVIGAQLIAPIAPWLGRWAATVEQHHERYDGAGYPHRLSGEQISLGARIVAVADSYETMTAARAYKRPLSPSAARAELVRGSGTQFDPEVVRAFLNISVGRLWRTVGLTALISQVPLLPRVSTEISRVGPQVASTAATGAAVALVAAGGIASGASQLRSEIAVAPASAAVASSGLAATGDEPRLHPQLLSTPPPVQATPTASPTAAPTAPRTTASNSTAGTASGGDSGDGASGSKSKTGGNGKSVGHGK